VFFSFLSHFLASDRKFPMPTIKSRAVFYPSTFFRSGFPNGYFLKLAPQGSHLGIFKSGLDHSAGWEDQIVLAHSKVSQVMSGYCP